jgi:hypothetical protein
MSNPLTHCLCLPIYPEALDINYAIYSIVHQAPKKSKVIWTLEEDAMLVQINNNGYCRKRYVLPSLAGAKGPSRCAFRLLICNH